VEPFPAEPLRCSHSGCDSIASRLTSSSGVESAVKARQRCPLASMISCTNISATCSLVDFQRVHTSVQLPLLVHLAASSPRSCNTFHIVRRSVWRDRLLQVDPSLLSVHRVSRILICCPPVFLFMWLAFSASSAKAAGWSCIIDCEHGVMTTRKPQLPSLTCAMRFSCDQ